MRTVRVDRIQDQALIWHTLKLIQGAHGAFRRGTVTSLTGLMGVSEKTTRTYLDYLIDVRVIEQLDIGCRIVNAGEAPPLPATTYGRDRLIEQALWNAMRTMRIFRPDELAITASTDDAPVTPAAAVLYCKNLARANILALLDRRTYQLLPAGNTGPRAPMVVCEGNQRSLFDFNVMRSVNVNGRRTVARAA